MKNIKTLINKRCCTVLTKKRAVMEIMGQCEGSANKGTRGTADDLNAIIQHPQSGQKKSATLKIASDLHMCTSLNHTDTPRYTQNELLCCYFNKCLGKFGRFLSKYSVDYKKIRPILVYKKKKVLVICNI